MPWRPGGVPQPTSGRPLVAEGRAYPVASATLRQHLATEHWDETTGSWRYGADDLRVHLGLELVVDDRSGDDGELAPDLRLEISSLPCPAIADLTGRRLDELGVATGWFGNDAPALDAVELTLVDLRDPATAVVEVAAAYRWQPDRPARALAFTGPVQLEPLWLQVKHPDDAPRFLHRAFGPGWDDALRLEEDGMLEMATASPPDRRRWFRYRCLPR